MQSLWLSRIGGRFRGYGYILRTIFYAGLGSKEGFRRNLAGGRFSSVRSPQMKPSEI